MSDIPKWYKRRGYAHFDRARDRRYVVTFVEDAAKVARYAFWPFLYYEKMTARRKYRRDPEGNQTKQRTRDEPKPRPITYSAHLDSHIFAKYALDLGTALEDHEYSENHPFATSVLAYRRRRPPKSNIHFATEAFQEVQRRGECDAIAIDIEAFFDSLDHGQLKARWASVIGSASRLPPDHYAIYRAVTERRHVDRAILRKILKRDIPRKRMPGNRRICSAPEFRAIVRDHVSPPAHRGIPQGSPISAVLANLYMLDVDKELYAKLATLDASYRRYSDDILVICGPGQVHEVEALVASVIETAHLKIKDSKTLRIAIRDRSGGPKAFEIPKAASGEGLGTQDGASKKMKPRSLSYLGFEWDGCRMSIRSQTMARFLKKLTRGVMAARLAAAKRSEVRIRRAKLYKQFSVLGWSPKAIPRERSSPDEGARRHGNFLDYGLNAVTIAGHDTIRRQLGKQWQRLHREIDKAEKVLLFWRDNPARAALVASGRRKKPRRRLKGPEQ